MDDTNELKTRQALVDASRHLHDTGLVTGTSGNLSVRVGDQVLVTPSGVSYQTLEPGDIARVTLDGEVLDAGATSPSSETPLHLGIYRTTDAQAIVHTHAPWATAVGLVRDELPSVHYSILLLGGPIRVAPYATFGSQELADNVRLAMLDRRAALMRNHGAVASGATLAEAVHNAESVEWLARLYLRAAQLGEPATLTSEQLEDVWRRATASGYRP
ncbi:class II aldolase/adducin family protein [Streptomyces sp. WAC 00631]|uniref:class II aldolase/adducin family protein n=1 Tax=unclassified Streptomyces TaxID=2593676 RepID=UPI001E3120DB|nr:MULTISPECIES: class II aldolase/adducin family protein [unclassified Streptomyces]MCC5036483.1 class II aldolase/adducin family protein [Streptomyces sp. WAC 00631]MCC9738368.1 class II aldolase/adducin family protein [Streptomyces sp. MNU89]